MNYTKNTMLISALVIAAIALGNAGSTLYFPALPMIAKYLHTSGAMMKLTLSMYLMGFGLSQLFYGPLSDIYGRRIILLIGLLIFTLGTIMALFATSISSLLLGRLIEGLGIGAANAVGYALMRDIYSGHKLNMQISYISVFVGVMPLVAPLLGGYLVTYISWQACFMALATLAIILLVCKVMLLPETLAHKKNAVPLQIIKDYYFLLTRANYIGFVLCASLAFAALLTTGSMLPFLVINKLGISSSVYGWVAGIPAIGYLSGSFISGKISAKFERSKLIHWAIILDVIVLIAAIIINFNSFNLASLVAPLIFFMFGLGFIFSLGASGAMAPYPELAGSEAALLGTLMFGIASIFTAVGSHLKEDSPIPLYSLLLGISILTYIMLLIAKREIK